MASLKNKFDKNNWGWSWLERWMAAKPWENRLMEKLQTDPSETTPLSKGYVNNIKGNRSKSSERGSVRVRRNNVITRISARPPLIGQVTRSSSSPSSEFRYDESSASSSICTSTTPVSGNTNLASDRTDESNISKPSYMNLTEAAKAKRRNSSNNRALRRSMDEFQFFRKSAVFGNGNSKSSGGSDPSFVNMSGLLCNPTRVDKSSTKLRERENCFYDD